MGENQEKKTEYDLDRLLQSAFGYDDDQLLKELQLAEETIDDSCIPPASEDGFERLMAEIDRRGIVPHYENPVRNAKTDIVGIGSGRKEVKKEEGAEKRKIRAIGPILKVALAVAILASVLAMTGIQAGAKKGYTYTKRINPNGKNSIVLNNDGNMQLEGKLDKAYREIHDQIGINVLQLGDRPEELQYLKTAISKNRATMYFDYNGASFYIIQQLKADESSINFVSDRLEGTVAYNGWLGRDIRIEKAITDDGGEEFSADIIEGNSFYYLAGSISEEVFRNIVEDVYLTE